ncbi:hypothetical protein OMAG_000094 [Candidatus Omnitrophus magneticus]|uniref:Uncharacterized protein n=1 Tax=Candidatus Omnitrophus magneticus TaxID=1609969 RepID=A0A0F0CRV2_9BACT|nr:hypothetical protein OMAG_000094 [Candidatus Omnitrophus magneticus]
MREFINKESAYIKSVGEHLEFEEKNVIPDRDTTQTTISSAKFVIYDLRPRVVDIIVMPGSEIYVSQQESINKATSKKLHKSYGLDTLPYSYKYGKEWKESLKILMTERIIPSFEKILSEGNKTRILLYLPLNNKERNMFYQKGGLLEKLIGTQKFNQIKEYITVISEDGIPVNGIIDNPMHIILGKGLLNYERYRKGDFGKSARYSESAALNLAGLIEHLSEPDAIKFSDFANNPAKLIEALINGSLAIKIRKIDFEKIRDMEKSMEMVMKSL